MVQIDRRTLVWNPHPIIAVHPKRGFSREFPEGAGFPARDPSLRLKDGYGRDDAVRMKLTSSFPRCE